MSARMRKQFQQGELGSAELVCRKGNFYLHISITIPAPEVIQPRGSLGVDLGFNRVAVTSEMIRRWLKWRPLKSVGFLQGVGSCRRLSIIIRFAPEPFYVPTHFLRHNSFDSVEIPGSAEILDHHDVAAATIHLAIE